MFDLFIEKYLQESLMQIQKLNAFKTLVIVADVQALVYATFSNIHGVNLEIRVQTPGKLASAQPMPHEMIPARK